VVTVVSQRASWGHCFSNFAARLHAAEGAHLIKELCLLSCLALFSLSPSVSAQLIDSQRQVSQKEAGDLVKTWLTSQGYDTKSRRFFLEPDPDHPGFPDFYFLSPAYEQDQSIPTLGHFAVNRNTGEVWDWELCHLLHSRALRRTQKSLRRRLGLSDQQFSKPSKLAP